MHKLKNISCRVGNGYDVSTKILWYKNVQNSTLAVSGPQNQSTDPFHVVFGLEHGTSHVRSDWRHSLDTTLNFIK